MGTGTYTGTGTGTTKTLGKFSSGKKKKEVYKYLTGPLHHIRTVEWDRSILDVPVWVSPSFVCVRQDTPLFCSSGLQSTALFFRLLAGEGRRAADSLSDRGSLSGAMGWETRTWFRYYFVVLIRTYLCTAKTVNPIRTRYSLEYYDYFSIFFLLFTYYLPVVKGYLWIFNQKVANKR